MKKVFLLFAAAGFLITAGTASAASITLIEQGAEWQYQQFDSPDLWPNWSTQGYTSFDWGNDTWSTGNAAFGNYYSNGLSYNLLSAGCGAFSP